MEKCKYCRWYKVNGHWESECSNKNCEYYGEHCVEKDPKEPSECDYKEKQQ